MNSAQVLQIMRFGVVGVTAALVHFSTVVLLVQDLHYAPLIANIAGFIVSFQFSYFGHRIWTFSETEVSHREAYPKLALIQSFNFGINEFLYYFLLSMNLPYQPALIIVILVMPIFTYFVSKWWVFQSA
jgi:putative flippase GtrA